MTKNTIPVRELLKDRILVLDGAMGTMIQRYHLSEADYRGLQFSNHPRDLKGNNDLLCITQPHIILDIPQAIPTLQEPTSLKPTPSTAPRISQSDYGLEDMVYDINLAAARIARQAADEFTEKET